MPSPTPLEAARGVSMQSTTPRHAGRVRGCLDERAWREQ